MEDITKKRVRKVNCITLDKGRRCNAFLGDIAADEPSTTNFRPCENCKVSWNVVQDEAGLLKFTKIPKGTIKNYDQETICCEE